MKKQDFKDKVVWITGASSGIGASLALQLNELGATVIASARRAEKLEELKEAAAHPLNFLTVPLDITKGSSINKAVAEVGKLDRLDLVIHNAGIAQKGLVTENNMDIDRRIMETNYFGTVALTKAIMPLYLKQGHGGFSVVSSFAGVMGIPGRSAYAASKHALHGFFESLEAENIGCRLRVSYVVPGFINTEITAKGLCGDGKAYGRVETSHRLGMSACQCARGIIRGLEKGKRQIVVGKIEVYLMGVNRISPALGRYIIRNHPMRKMRKLKSLFARKAHPGHQPLAEPRLSGRTAQMEAGQA
ncbi:SDR family NAD(P)-dependent oxidoreductase [Robiginitalea sp. SC105]|uniref:SDR family NAD(P)-dependent oxidoreductase n=1 Tax=Robiginitalea sp. SC105 TaxID=2762332 RepID=UPI001639F6BF|nr:SDR family NAD(P)-dependent oxidoreductase [Robiginitalea sp. SC105]MBC2838144.1 SDR family NAD(P)-dependent oxidoreductase [Robiginitalea sp. SC105]